VDLQGAVNMDNGGVAIKMAKRWLSGLLASALFVSCNGFSDTNIDFKLRGTWESTDTSLYSGKLVIDFDTITITGYEASQTPSVWDGGDDSKRPFRDFAKNAPLVYYTEDGKLFIKIVGDVLSVPYDYYADSSGKYLYFTFGGRPEALKRMGN
jgi:hypothetical protein